MILQYDDTLIPVSCCCFCYCCVTSVVSDSVRPHRQQPTRLLHPWDSPSKNTGVGCHFLLQCMKVKTLYTSKKVGMLQLALRGAGLSPNYMAPVLNIMVIPSPPRDHIKRYWINF